LHLRQKGIQEKPRGASHPRKNTDASFVYRRRRGYVYYDAPYPSQDQARKIYAGHSPDDIAPRSYHLSSLSLQYYLIKGKIMEKSRSEKLNEYAARVKAGETLTPEEIADRDRLRQEFIAEFRKNFRAQLDNTVIQYPDGTKKSLKKD
jgi:uncharacterized protein YnzC (UPF0291/DUF896 family)